MSESERCGLVFVKTGSINSGTVHVLAVGLTLRINRWGQLIGSEKLFKDLENHQSLHRK
jgi:hypothetical protein